MSTAPAPFLAFTYAGPGLYLADSPGATWRIERGPVGFGNRPAATVWRTTRNGEPWGTPRTLLGQAQKDVRTHLEKDTPMPDATATAEALSAHTETDYQVWVVDRVTGLPTYAYRTGLIYSVAQRWTAAWNDKPPADVMAGSTFMVVTATTTYTEGLAR